MRDSPAGFGPRRVVARRHGLALAAALLGAALFPAGAAAHGLTGRADLPIPTWLFSWAAALVLVVSFVGLAVLWPTPRLEREDFRPVPRWMSRGLTSKVLEIACGLIGVALLLFVLWCGMSGTAIPTDNFAPTFVYVVFWLGLLPVSVLLGDVFSAFNPWRAVGRAVGSIVGSAAPEPLAYPARLGRWPAAIGLFGFGYLELVSSVGELPGTLAIAAGVYSAATFVGMALYGTDAWLRYGETFSVYFNFFSRLSVFERRGDEIGIRPPLSGLARLDIVPGTVAVLAVMIGVVSFDGLSGGPSWQQLVSPVIDFFREDVGMSAKRSLETAYGLGLVAVVAIVYGFYRLGIAGAHTVDPDHSPRELARAFVPSLVPIALAYAAAHYVSLLVFQGQALAALVSDPLGRDANLFGTATWTIDYTIIGAEAFWYLQLAFVLLGHIAGLVLAHDRALVLYGNSRTAVRSQYWMLAVMVGFTTLALWLLSEASKG
jgi:hypothetical protein